MDQERQAFIQGLRELADFLESGSGAAFPLLLNPVSLGLRVQNVETLVKYANLLGTVSKRQVTGYIILERHFGPHVLDVWTTRAEVCTRRVIGTREVPGITLPARTEEIVEWEYPESLIALIAEKGDET